MTHGFLTISVRFITSRLSDRDRLAVINFNSRYVYVFISVRTIRPKCCRSAHAKNRTRSMTIFILLFSEYLLYNVYCSASTQHGLLRMNEERKRESGRALQNTISHYYDSPYLQCTDSIVFINLLIFTDWPKCNTSLMRAFLHSPSCSSCSSCSSPSSPSSTSSTSHPSMYVVPTARIVNELGVSLGTNIYDGMMKAFKVLSDRRQKNTSSCLFLLTDGCDNAYKNEKKVRWHFTLIVSLQLSDGCAICSVHYYYQCSQLLRLLVRACQLSAHSIKYSSYFKLIRALIVLYFVIQELAARMRAEGISVFFFGFGYDHDSSQMEVRSVFIIFKLYIMTSRMGAFFPDFL